jgi:hypothetical protein
MSDPVPIEVVPATPERWDDVVDLLGVSGEKGCWCQAWRGKDEVARASGESRPQTLRRQMTATDPPPPGYVAYLDPIDPQGARVEVGAGFVGIASMFDAQGFRRVLVTDGHSGRLPRLLVRLDFG